MIIIGACIICILYHKPYFLLTGIGLQVSDVDSPSKHLAEGIIQAIATGTFLYITFVEIITPELNKPDLPPLLKVRIVVPAQVGGGAS